MILFKNIGLIVTCLLLGTAVSPAEARPMRLDISEQARLCITEKKLALAIEFLSDSLCAGRGAGTVGAAETASWLQRRFTKFGLVPSGPSYQHSFALSGGSAGRNVIGIAKGCDSPAKKYILVMASYDGLGIRGGKIYPGADSNGSGVAALLSLAKMMALSRSLGREYEADVIFAALDAKYMSFAGSNALWQELAAGTLKDAHGRTISRKEIVIVINLDQVGSSLSPLKSGRKDYIIALNGGFATKELAQANKSKGTGLEMSHDYYGSPDFTNVFYRRTGDHKVFAEHGMPVVLFTSGITDNNNKLTDTLENLDLPVLKKRIYLIWNFTEKMAGIKKQG